MELGADRTIDTNRMKLPIIPRDGTHVKLRLQRTPSILFRINSWWHSVRGSYRLKMKAVRLLIISNSFAGYMRDISHTESTLPFIRNIVGRLLHVMRLAKHWIVQLMQTNRLHEVGLSGTFSSSARAIPPFNSANGSLQGLPTGINRTCDIGLH